MASDEGYEESVADEEDEVNKNEDIEGKSDNNTVTDKDMPACAALSDITNLQVQEV